MCASFCDALSRARRGLGGRWLTVRQGQRDRLADVEALNGICSTGTADDAQSLLDRHIAETPLSRANLQDVPVVVPREPHDGVATLLVAEAISLIVIELKDSVSTGVHADLSWFVRGGISVALHGAKRKDRAR